MKLIPGQTLFIDSNYTVYDNKVSTSFSIKVPDVDQDCIFMETLKSVLNSSFLSNKVVDIITIT